MQTLAPERTQPQLHLVPSKCPLRVAGMRPGEQFMVPSHSSGVVALLTHKEIDIRDVRQIWVVIVATNDVSNDELVGSIIPVPHDAEVQVLSQISPPRYCMGG